MSSVVFFQVTECREEFTAAVNFTVECVTAVKPLVCS